jgi:hypothetical protein
MNEACKLVVRLCRRQGITHQGHFQASRAMTRAAKRGVPTLVLMQRGAGRGRRGAGRLSILAPTTVAFTLVGPSNLPRRKPSVINGRLDQLSHFHALLHQSKNALTPAAFEHCSTFVRARDTRIRWGGGGHSDAGLDREGGAQAAAAAQSEGEVGALIESFVAVWRGKYSTRDQSSAVRRFRHRAVRAQAATATEPACEVGYLTSLKTSFPRPCGLPPAWRPPRLNYAPGDARTLIHLPR